MTTLIFYNFILFSSTFFVWLSEKSRTYFDKMILLFIAFLIVFLPSAIRYDIGVDYLNYLEIYNNEWFKDYINKEPSFYFINLVFKNLDVHFQLLIVTFAFIFTIVAFKAYPKKNAWLLHFIFFSLMLYFSFSTMRQAVSISFCLLALFYFFEKRYLIFLVLIIIGSTFHQSILLIIILGFFAIIPLNIYIKTYLIPILFICFIFFAYISMNFLFVFIEQFLILINFSEYSNYFNSSTHFQVNDFGSGYGVFAKVLFSIYIILNTKQFVKLNPNYWLIIILNFIYAVGTVLANNIIIFDRMVAIFVSGPIIGAFLLFQLQKNKNIHRFVLMIFLIFLTLSFNKEGMSIETSFGNPKLNPYKTIIGE